MVRKDNSFEESIVLKRLSEGSEKAFRILYDHYYKRIYRTAERFLQSPDLAEDVVQEVFSMIWIHREEMAEVRSFEAYIRVVAKNQIYTLLRKISYEERQKEVFNTVVQSSVSNGDFALLDDQNEQLLNTILSKLPLRQQEVYNLSRNEGLSHDVIANRLNISQGTVKNHLVRALNTIRQQLSPYVDTHLMLLVILMTR